MKTATPTGARGARTGRFARRRVLRATWALWLAASCARAADVAPPPNTQDRLQLVDGNALIGAIQNPSFALRTSYASLEFAVADLARIEVERPPNNLTTLRTVYQDRCSGFLENADFQLRASDGTTQVIRRELVQTVLFAPRKTPDQAGVAEVAVALRNGDLWHGALRARALRLAADGEAQREVPWADAAFITFTGAPSPRVGIRMLTGETWQGTLVGQNLEVELRTGTTLTLFASRIQMIDRRRGIGSADPRADGSSARSWASAGGADTLVWIPPGEFLLGSPTSEAGRDLDEGPLTPVKIPEGFWLGRFEVTQAEYEAVMGSNPSQYAGAPDYPVEKVSWEDAQVYCQRLTRLHQDTGAIPDRYAYRLPTEAEWEYACRAGSTTAFSYGEDPDARALADYAWFTSNSGSSPREVGTKRPNPWGLHDLHGNVWEWCLDRWTEADRGTPRANRVIAATGHLRVARGGSWLYSARHCRSANRDEYAADNRCSDVGFRVVLAPDAGAALGPPGDGGLPK